MAHDRAGSIRRLATEPGAPAESYAWFVEACERESDGFSATFVRNLSAEEALRRIGVTPGDVSGEGGIEAWAASGGAVLVDYGYVELPEALSRGTEAATVFSGFGEEDFVYTVDGVVVTRFELYLPDWRQGSDPDRLLAHMRDLGMPVEEEDPDYYRVRITRALALAERATSVHLSPAHHAIPAITGSVDGLY
ncbi:DUF6461 domain-containing protein [Nonomuraea dietziae]|uniref:DUF6461 domain-containing protein n=1 Tax=Nonomuraea dietziae TaxID=65515 RepID=UPI00341BA3AA